jgi:putative effector of murein hydrolase LrgA (UPF0299 family)
MMLQTLGLLSGCQLAGEFVARGLGLPIPGPVLGLVILLAALALKPSLTRALRPTTQVILAHLSLMFVPAGVGVIGNLEVLSSDWARLLVVLTLSTILSMLVTIATYIAMKQLMYRLQNEWFCDPVELLISHALTLAYSHNRRLFDRRKPCRASGACFQKLCQTHKTSRQIAGRASTQHRAHEEGHLQHEAKAGDACRGHR